MEVWKDIPGYEGLYQVSNLGNVRSLHKHKKGNLLKEFKNADGYFQAYLYKDKARKTVRVHRLVAQAFIPNPLNLQFVNHKDENPANNQLENLEWCDRSYNINYGTRNKRVSERMKTVWAARGYVKKSDTRKFRKSGRKIAQYDLNGNLIAVYNSVTRAAEATSSNHSSICKVCLGKQLITNGYKWAYAD